MTIRGFPPSLPEAEIKGLLETIGQVRLLFPVGFYFLPSCAPLALFSRHHTPMTRSVYYGAMAEWRPISMIHSFLYNLFQ